MPAASPSTISPTDPAYTPPRDPGGKGIEPTTPQSRKAPRVLTNEHQSDEEIERVNQLINLFQQARAHRRPMVSRWNRNYRMLRNRFWDPAHRPGWMPSPQIPEIFPIVDALVSWEMDQNPRYNISPQALPHTSFHNFFVGLADDLEIVMDASYTVNAELTQWAIANWDKYVYGTGIVKTTWDMTLAGGLGDATTRRVSPYAFYPDPQATSLEDANYLIEVSRMSVQELDRRWPGTAKLFPVGGQDHDIDLAPNQLDQASNGQPPRANPGAISPVTTPMYGKPGGARISAVDIPGVTVLQCWVREHETYTATDINTGQDITRVYDTWRLIVVAGNRIIMDEPAENLWSHGKHPYDRLVVRDTGEFWGFSLVEDLTPTMQSYNRLLASLQQNVELTGNPVFKDAGNMTRTPLTNKPGQRVAVGMQGAGDTGWLNPPQMHAAHPKLVEHMLQRMEAIAGLSAVMKGNSPSGRNAQGVIDAMQEAGFVRIRSSLQFLEAAMRGAGEKKADLIIDNYTTPRIVSIAGPGGARTSRALKARHFLIPTSKGATPLRYQLLVDVGSRRHTSRQMREDRAVQLFTLGAIDREALLSDVEYPNASVVAQRMDAREQQLAALGEQAGPGKRERARA